ncbi:MAG: DUF6763 family protein [Pseudomonadota bacterium]
MTTETDPIVGQWYFLSEKGEPYQVTAFDEDAGAITMENVDGDVETTDIDTWFTLDIEAIEDPEGSDDDDDDEDVDLADADFDDALDDEGDDSWGSEYDE